MRHFEFRIGPVQWKPVPEQETAKRDRKAFFKDQLRNLRLSDHEIFGTTQPQLDQACCIRNRNLDQLAGRGQKRPPVRIGMRFRTNRRERQISEMKFRGPGFRDDRAKSLNFFRFVDRHDQKATEVSGQLTFQEVRR